MIAKFPDFTKLSLEDKKEIESITAKFPPYSDYNFTSLWSYDVENDIIISNLNDNLVIRFRDYITNEPFYSFLGVNKVKDTIDTLLKKAKEDGFMPCLKLIPETVCHSGDPADDCFLFEEDQDSFDYILSLEEMKTLYGTKYHSKRGAVNKFTKENPDCQFKILDLINYNCNSELINVFLVWEKSKKKEKKDTEHELKALERLINASKYLNLIALGIYKNNQLIGFIITEKIFNDYAIGHFVKADSNYHGIFEVIYKNIAEHLYNIGCRFFNIEQDLGLEGLRKSKTLWQPEFFLKKFIVRPRMTKITKNVILGTTPVLSGGGLQNLV